MEYIDFATRHWHLFAALVAITAVLIGTEVLRKLRGVVAVNPTRLTQLLNHDDAVVVDIRDAADYKAGHIAQAHHISFSELKQGQGKGLKALGKYKDKPIIVYCRNGTQGNAAGGLLKKAGFTQVHSLAGGIAAWQTANLPVTKK